MDPETPAEERPLVHEPRRPRYSRTITTLAWVLPAVAILALAVIQLRSRSGPTGALSVAAYQAEAEVVASPAPDLQLPDLVGVEQRSLTSLRGHVVVLNFWASWCSPCRSEAPDLERTWEAYRARGVRFLGVDYRDNSGAGQAFVREFGLSYPSAQDPSGQYADDFQLLGMPTTFIVDPEGQIVYRFTGIVSAPVLQAALDDVLTRGGA